MKNSRMIKIEFDDAVAPRVLGRKGIGAYPQNTLIMKSVEFHPDYDELMKHKVTKFTHRSLR